MGERVVLIDITRRCYAQDVPGLEAAVRQLNYENREEIVEAVDWSGSARDVRIALAKQLRAHGVEREWLDVLAEERPNLQEEIAAARAAILGGDGPDPPTPTPAEAPDLPVDAGLDGGVEARLGPRDDFLSLAYLEQIVRRARGVGRVRISRADGSEHFGTGWLAKARSRALAALVEDATRLPFRPAARREDPSSRRPGSGREPRSPR